MRLSLVGSDIRSGTVAVAVSKSNRQISNTSFKLPLDIFESLRNNVDSGLTDHVTIRFADQDYILVNDRTVSDFLSSTYQINYMPTLVWPILQIDGKIELIDAFESDIVVLEVDDKLRFDVIGLLIDGRFGNPLGLDNVGQRFTHLLFLTNR